MSYTIALSDKTGDRLIIGGKALELSKLSELFNVPSGFVVTTKAFNYFLKFNSLSEDDQGRISKKLIMEGSFPDEIKKEIERRLFKNTSLMYAVRSSGIKEDGKKYSYAGQYESFLSVSADKIFYFIKACWASLYATRVLEYSKKSSHEIGTIAVIVQEMVFPDVSGVAFSEHPVSDQKDVIVIEAVKGVANQLVQGSVTPHHYVVDKKMKTVIEAHYPGEKNDILLKQLNLVVKLVQDVEVLYNEPIDVEWAISQGSIYVLQVRPITALY